MCVINSGVGVMQPYAEAIIDVSKVKWQVGFESWDNFKFMDAKIELGIGTSGRCTHGSACKLRKVLS